MSKLVNFASILDDQTRAQFGRADLADDLDLVEVLHVLRQIVNVKGD